MPTTVQDSGLLEAILPAFEEGHPGQRVRVVAAGSGELLALAGRGDLDVVITHAPRAEEEFMAGGDGRLDRAFMENDFMIVGPPDDPAGVRGGRDAVTALGRISEARTLFLSRGDRSGTHLKELELRAIGDLEPSGPGYRELGQGMGDLLLAASDLGAYTLVDRGTYLHLSDRLDLEVLVEGDARLRNVYSVIVPASAVNAEGALRFVAWLLSDAGRREIAAYGADRFGHPLFLPLDRDDASSGLTRRSFLFDSDRWSLRSPRRTGTPRCSVSGSLAPPACGRRAHSG